MLESALQTKVLKNLRANYPGVWINQSPSKWAKQGISDITGTLAPSGKSVAIELKQPGKYRNPIDGLTQAQINFLFRVKSAGGLAIVADSWETVDSCLQTGKSNL
jgi:hypothetical protein